MDWLLSSKDLRGKIKQLEGEVERLTKECLFLREKLGQGIGEHADPSDRIAREFAEAIAYRGDAENRLYRAFLGSEAPIASAPAPLPFSSTLCQQAHFGLDQYRFWIRAMKERPRFLRKQWEFVFIAQSLFERGCLTQGKRGLVFGVGREPLPGLFASFGCEIVATDQSIESAERGGWITTGQHAPDLAPLNERGICTDAMFRALVSFAAVDMNDIPSSLDGGFDFCWSACSLEHLGSLQNGLSFIARSLETLKPGGVAVHTTEFNLSSNDRTIETADLSLFRRRDIESLVATLEGRGYRIAPIDWTVGEGFAERVVDLPPFGRGEPHLRLRAGEFDMTSIGLIIERP
jgi:SAM-dependent methyltransferase